MDALAPLIAAKVLALVYVAGPWLDTRGETAGVWTRRRWVSLAAGVSAAYEFVDILPELGARHRAFVESAGEGLLSAEQCI